MAFSLALCNSSYLKVGNELQSYQMMVINCFLSYVAIYYMYIYNNGSFSMKLLILHNWLLVAFVKFCDK